jgi:hypothetical protein
MTMLTAERGVQVPTGKGIARQSVVAWEFARVAIQRGYTAREMTLLVLLAAARRRGGEGSTAILAEALTVIKGMAG